MYFSASVALVALPFLVGAVPAQSSLRDLISIPLTKRSTFHRARRVGFDPASFEASIHQTVAKFQRGFEAFERNTGSPHPLALKQRQLDKRLVGVVPLTDCESGTLWSGEIMVGTPPRTFIVDFDTGSADLVLPGPNCPSCGARNAYDPSLSACSKNLWTPFNVSNINGGASGELLTDNVSAGGFEATNQTLGAASEYGSTYSSIHFQADGVLGMAFKEISQFNSTPFFATLVGQNQLQDSIFGVVLAETNSELIIGGRKFNGSITYAPVTVAGYWQTVFQNITVNGVYVQASNTNAIIDTGVTQIIGDVADIANIYQNIPGSAQIAQSGLWIIPCNTSVSVTIDFVGTTFNISPSTYVLGTTSPGSNSCLGGFATTPGVSFGFWIMGDVFMQNVYTEFDFVNQVVGFGSLA